MIRFPSSDDVIYGGGFQSLSIGQTYKGNESFTISNQVGNPIFIIAVTGLSFLQKESDVTNNTQIVRVTNLYSPAKLKKCGLVFTGSDIPAGKTVEQLGQIGGKFDFVNNGDTTISQVPMNIYLSQDIILDKDDQLLSTSFARLLDDKGIWNSIYGFIPPGIKTGSYYLIAHLDPYNYVAEYNENNNFYNVAINVVSGMASDLLMENVVFPDSIMIYGQNWNFKSTVKNQGLGDSRDFFVRYYLQKDNSEYAKPQFNKSLFSFASQYLNEKIDKGAIYNQNYAGTIGSKIPPGIYYFAACLDANLGYDYPNNNCVVYNKPITVLASPMSLKEKDEPITTVKLFPNPVTQKLTITATQQIQNIEIYASDGRKIIFIYKDEIIDLLGLPAGLYHTLIQFPNNTVSRSFVKE